MPSKMEKMKYHTYHGVFF